MRTGNVGRFLATWWRLIAISVTVGVVSMCVAPVALHFMVEKPRPTQTILVEPVVQPAEPERDSFDERAREWRAQNAEAEKRRIEGVERAMAEVAEREEAQKRKVRRFRWESPAETRGRIWNVPDDEVEDALLTALLRVCISEGDGDPRDCAGIWQVVKNNRQRSCRRGVVRRITECDENGETHLSALRRHQRHVLGKMKARNRRAVWIRNLTPECEMPDGYMNYIRRRGKRVTREFAENHWDARYGSKTCPQTVADARRLIEGKLPEPRPGARAGWLPGRPVTWGGRCEEKMGSCDDRMACERVLARIPNTETLNAFWCRIGNSGCRTNPEPLCERLGYRYKRVKYKNRMVWKLGSPLDPLVHRPRGKQETLADNTPVAQPEPSDS